MKLLDSRVQGAEYSDQRSSRAAEWFISPDEEDVSATSNRLSIKSRMNILIPLANASVGCSLKYCAREEISCASEVLPSQNKRTAASENSSGYELSGASK